MARKSAIYQGLVFPVVNLIFSTVWVARKVPLYIYIRHTDLRDLTANIMSKVCMSIEIEPKPTPLSGEKLQVLAAVQCYE